LTLPFEASDGLRGLRDLQVRSICEPGEEVDRAAQFHGVIVRGGTFGHPLKLAGDRQGFDPIGFDLHVEHVRPPNPR
jgi:hypothetical protein